MVVIPQREITDVVDRLISETNPIKVTGIIALTGKGLMEALLPVINKYILEAERGQKIPREVKRTATDYLIGMGWKWDNVHPVISNGKIPRSFNPRPAVDPMNDDI